MDIKEKLEVIKALQNCGVRQYRLALEEVEKDLEQKEKQDKILERFMFYSERKKLGEEYIEWAVENKVNKNDLTNIITWCFCIKLRSWLDNDK